MSLLLLFSGARARAAIEIEAELNGVGGGWTTLTDAQRTPAISFDYGMGAGPLDLVAGTGTMSFALDNGPSNSAHLLGLYSPDHANCLAGWGLGIRVRFVYTIAGTSYYKFVGTIDSIDPMSGLYQERKVLVTAVDWMDDAALYRPNVGTQDNKRIDEVVTSLVDAMPKQPVSRDFDTGSATWTYSLDTDRSEADPVLTVFQRLAQSEGVGRIYIKGDTTAGGVLRVESRTARFSPSSVATFDDTMISLSAPHQRGLLVNRVKATTHPRTVDAAATTQLFKLNQVSPSIHSVPALNTITIEGVYKDVNNPARRVGGKDMVAPAATTDYTMNTQADGLGTNLTASFDVTASYGANKVIYTVTNNSTSLGYITKLRARGRTLSDDDPPDTIVTDDESISEFGERPLDLDMPYESSVSTALPVAQYMLSVWSQPNAVQVGMPMIPANDTDLATIMALEPGDCVKITESVTGVTDGVYYINHVSMTLEESTLISCEWTLQRSLATPTIEARTHSFDTVATTSHTVSLPSGIVAGNLLIVVFTVDATTVTFPAGWTVFAAQDSVLTVERMEIAYRLADGSEGSTITVTTSTAEESTHASFRILGAEDPGTQPPEAEMATGAAALATPTIQPPSITPTGGEKNYLFIVVAGIPTPPAITAVGKPAGYENLQLEDGGAAYNTLTAERARLTSSESPTQWTVNGVHAEWMTFTVAVHPVTP